MSQITREIIKPKLLIGEGKDEVRFFQALIAKMEITDIQVEDYSGKGNLSKYIKTLKVRPGFSSLVSLGITRDADLSAETAFASISKIIQDNKLSVPNAVVTLAPGTPSVAIYIFPDGINSGMLEDLCLSSVENDPSMECVEQYFECLKQKDCPQPNNMAKARVHAWLAAQKEPDKRLAEAAEAGYWNWDSPAFDSLKQFLQGL